MTKERWSSIVTVMVPGEVLLEGHGRELKMTVPPGCCVLHFGEAAVAELFRVLLDCSNPGFLEDLGREMKAEWKTEGP